MKGALRLSGTLLALIVLLIAASHPWRAVAPKADAHIPHPGLNFSLEVAAAAGCNTSSGDATCALTPGHEFTLNVNLGPLPSDIPSYAGFDIDVTYQGVTSQGPPSTASWPDCVYSGLDDLNPGQILVGCIIGADAGPSTYTGTIATLQFACTQAGTFVLRNGFWETDLVEDLGAVHTDPRTTETLGFTCGSNLAHFADANCDGLVNSLDALLILQWNARLLDRLPCPEAADANADGVVDAVDAALVLQADAGLLALPSAPTTPTATPTPSVTPTPSSTSQALGSG